jgi:hypothetical protein
MQNLSKSQTLSTLQHIATIAQRLSDPHVVQFLDDPSHSGLHALISSAFNDLQNCLNNINAQAPISSLPIDVLGLIIQEVHQDELQTFRHPLTRAPLTRVVEADPTPLFQSPLLLSHVSQLWHEATIISPLLWTTIAISPLQGLRSLCLAELFLARSKTCPIFLNIIAKFPAESRSEKKTVGRKNTVPGHLVGHDNICTVVVRHISRCRSIFIRSDQYFLRLVDALHVRLRDLAVPLLEQLFLQIPDAWEMPEGHSDFIFTLGAPRLSFIHLSELGMLHWRPPFHLLTALHLDEQNDTLSGITLASQCPLLETLAIYGDMFLNTESESLVLPRLRFLGLYGAMNHVAYLLQALSSPSLGSLAIAPFHHQDLDLPEGYLDPKRFTSLKSITLAPFHQNITAALRSASGCFPSITDVTLIGENPSTLIHSLLEITDSDDVIFPKMQSLALRDLCCEHADPISQVIAFRSSLDRPLHILYLDKVSMLRMPYLQLKDKVQVVELDKWSNTRQGSLYCDQDDIFIPF